MPTAPVDPSQERKRARRIRSPHPGVVLIKPDPVARTSWRARYEDPDTGKQVKEKIDPLVASNDSTRKDWAIRKARALAKRRDEIKLGAPRTTGKLLADEVGKYFERHPYLRPRTRHAYKKAAAKLLAWAKREGLESCDEVTRVKLLDFRDSIITRTKRAIVRNGRRGERRGTSQPRSPHTINHELRSVGTVLGNLCDRDLLIRLTREDLKRALKQLDAPVERAQPLKPHELQKLIEAALRHDVDTFNETRREHRGKGEPGTTLRYRPIAPFVVFVMLSGMRFGEALGLEWSQVDLDALDHDGQPVGEIQLTAAKTKTRRARSVGLEVSPGLRKILAALRLKATARSVFEHSIGSADAAIKRLIAEYGAPPFGWQKLRQTCGCYLTNAPGIFGAASAYRSATQLGHSVAVAEKHYVNVVRGIPREARTLEAAMQIEKQLASLVAHVSVTPVVKQRRRLRDAGRSKHPVDRLPQHANA